MSHRPSSGSKFSYGHRRSESAGHQRYSSSNSGDNRSDSGHSLNFEHVERKQGHHHSKSVQEKVDNKESNLVGCKFCLMSFNTPLQKKRTSLIPIHL